MEQEKINEYKEKLSMEIAVKMVKLVNNFEKKNKIEFPIEDILKAFEANMYSVLVDSYNSKKINNEQLLALVDKSYIRLLEALHFTIDLSSLLKKEEKGGKKNGKRINWKGFKWKN